MFSWINNNNNNNDNKKTFCGRGRLQWIFEAMGFVSTRQVAKPKKSLPERRQGRGQKHTCAPARSPASIPQGEGVAEGERQKGGERKEEIVWEIYRPLQQLTEGSVHLFMMKHTHNNSRLDQPVL